MSEALISFLSFFIGVLVGLTGIGGAVLLTPTLIILGIPPALSVGTNLIINALMKGVGVFSYSTGGFVDRRAATLLLLGSFISMLAGQLALSFFHTQLSTLNNFILLLVIMAIAATIVSYLAEKKIFNKWMNGEYGFPSASTMILSGFIVGILIQFTGIGGGVLLMPLLLRWVNDHKRAVGTSLTYSFAASALALIPYTLLGLYRLDVALYACLGMAPGIYIGFRINKRIDLKTFKKALIPVLSLILLLLLNKFMGVR